MIDVNAIGAAGLQGVTHAPEQAAIGRADGAAPGDPSTRTPALAGGSCSGFRPTGVVRGAAGLPVGLHKNSRVGGHLIEIAQRNFIKRQAVWALDIFDTRRARRWRTQSELRCRCLSDCASPWDQRCMRPGRGSSCESFFSNRRDNRCRT